jgi:hypothetical protein
VSAGWPANVAQAAARIAGSGERRPVALLVLPDGWGRSQTLDATSELLEARGLRPVRVAGRVTDRDADLAPLREVAGSGSGTGRGAVKALRGALEDALGTDGVLLVDDAHWLDGASVRVLAGLVERVPTTGVGVVVAQ